MADEFNNVNGPNEQGYQQQPSEQYQQQPNGQYYQQPNPQGYNPQGYNPYGAPTPPKEEKANIGLAILSFFIPLVGLILFLTLKKDKPKTAKACGKAALICVILSIVVCIIEAVVGGLAVDKALNDTSDSSYVQSVDGDDDNTVTADSNSNANSSTGEIGDYVCVVKDATICKDWSGDDALLVTYEFTNNSSDAISFDVALSDKLYQDGIGLETAILDDETDWFVDVDIKPGVTKEVKKAYSLRDTTTSVEVEISELFSLSDDKITTYIDLQ